MNRQALRVNLYEIVSRAVEVGVALGYRRAHKHTAKPDETLIFERQEQAIMEALCEVIDFGVEEDAAV